ncbi:MAG TPA: serine hydrolase [Candidatus Saccharimonadales bacterium]|nr:serine hydrolase [Candidatus Saccharimonadales bacterium]
MFKNYKKFILLSTILLVAVFLYRKTPLFSNIRTILSPLPKDAALFAQIDKKLEKTPNTYSLQNQISIIPQADATVPYSDANSYVAIDFDTGKVLTQKNMNQKYEIASLTKIMTAVVTLDLASKDELLHVPASARRMPATYILVEPGEKLSVEELLHAALLTSANDAVEVLKSGVNAKYGRNIFIDAMNEKAVLIGLKNTHFANPQGFDDQKNYSSAGDLAILSHYALTNYPLIAQIAQKDYTLLPQSDNHKKFDLYNWNGLLDVYPGIFGLKIGNTGAAGTTMIAVSQRGGKKVLAVMLGAPGILQRDLWTSQILDTGFEKLANLPPVQVTEQELRAKYATWSYGT